MNANAKVIELSEKRDSLQAAQKSNEELRDRIVGLKKQLKKAKTENEQVALTEQIAALEATRGRSEEHGKVMAELADARDAARLESLDELAKAFAEKTDQELESLHLATTAERNSLNVKIRVLSRLRSSRAKVATNRSILAELTPAEILAALSPAQRAALVKK